MSIAFLKIIAILEFFFYYNGMISIEEIKKYMKENKISQIQLAEKSGIPLQTIRKVLCGITQTPRIDTMNAIITALGIEEKDARTPAPKSLEYLISDLRNLSPEKQEKLRPVIENLINALEK